MVLGLVLEMLLAMTAVEEGRHVELECYDSWKVGSMQGTNGAEVRLRAMNVGRKRATELVKARKMTKDGRNEHTSDYLSVYWMKNGKNSYG